MTSHWIPWVTWRFLTGRRSGRGRLVFLFSVLLICSGVGTLNTILAVMNGLQQGFISSILEIGSYHLRWIPNDNNNNINEILNEMNKREEVRIATPFREGQAMIIGRYRQPVGALLRGVPQDTYIMDEKLSDQLEIVEGKFDLRANGIVLGAELAMNLGVTTGKTISALSLAEKGITPDEIELQVNGLFLCNYKTYEENMAFVSYQTAESFLNDSPLEIGVKIKELDSEQALINIWSSDNIFSQGQFISWRESNRAFFSALKNEKMMMIVLLTLIFVVVAVNIDHSLRRMATERVEDISILKAIGASPREIRMLFLCHGLVIGGMGSLLGTLLGVFIGGNIHHILQFVRMIRMSLNMYSWNNVKLQSMETFFSSSQVIPKDIVIIILLAVILTFLATIRASHMAAQSKPAEVLRSE